jgi:hypothetical protein
MNIIKGLIIFCALAVVTTSSMAAPSRLTGNWTCTTNASSSDVKADKAADDKMAKNQRSGAAAFAFAAAHCRDCTKITCEKQK